MKSKSLVSSLLVLVLAVGCVSNAQRGALSIANRNFNQGKYPEALAALRRAENYQARAPEMKAGIHLLTAMSYEKLGELPEAVGEYKYVAETFPGTPHAFRAKERLSALGQ